MGLVSGFQSGKTLRAAIEAVVVLAEWVCPAISAFRAVATFISPSWIGWDLTAEQRFPVVRDEGGRGRLSLPAACLTANCKAA